MPIAGGLDTTEMKLSTYSKFPISKLFLGIKFCSKYNWLPLDILTRSRVSLHGIISFGSYKGTIIPRDDWKKLVPNASLQKNCNMQGFNVNPQPKHGATIPARARIGIVSNNENDCKSPDSFFGFGTHCGIKDISVGNEARRNCFADNGDISAAAWATFSLSNPYNAGALGRNYL
ncbi:uncharacterized protein LOC116616653 [Nematostella vectensis]|uniref:uncharacterized protein LOC116616653 n=1 Tax=Nematostella vectensis TaxID=45351 RepID=UPI0020774FB9|nr:uncharacterized protein LOC116616653 [Nematostella vectensis]